MRIDLVFLIGKLTEAARSAVLTVFFTFVRNKEKDFKVYIDILEKEEISLEQLNRSGID